MPDETDQSDRRIPELEALQPEVGSTRADPSPARLYVRANFDALSAARARGVTWHQIVATLNAAGVRGSDGTELDWRQVASLFHAERYAKGGKRKRRKGQPQTPRAKVEARAPEPMAADAPAPSPAPASAPPPAQNPAEGPAPAVADPELARRLAGIRTITDVPPPDFSTGWRRKGDKGNG